MLINKGKKGDKKKPKFVVNVSKTFESIVANFVGKVRHDQMGGRDYLVAPMIMMVEGVLNGTAGPVLYKGEDMGRFPSAWNNKPLVVYHPEMNGKGISACDPDILTSQGIGVIMNARVETIQLDGNDRAALKAEAWFEEERANAIDGRIMEAVQNKTPMELSTGLFIELEKEEGKFNGKDYIGIAQNYQPDHLALLPDIKGACSIADGAGFLMNEAGDVISLLINSFGEDQKTWIKVNKDSVLRSMSNQVTEFIENEMSHSNIRSLLQSLLRTTNEDLWIDEVFDSFFIYEDNGSLWKQDYTIASDKVEFIGERTEVVRIVEFRTKDGTFIGNRKGQSMKKKELVDALIANKKTKWVEDDREVLMAMNEETLDKIDSLEGEEAAASEGQEAAEANAGEANVGGAAESNAGEAAAGDKGEPTGNLSMKDFIDKKVPPELQEVLRNSVRMHEEAKEAIVKDLVANENCTFTEVYLKSKDLEELQNLQRLAGTPVVIAEPNVLQRFNYAGQGGPAQNAQVSGEALGIESVVG